MSALTHDLFDQVHFDRLCEAVSRTSLWALRRFASTCLTIVVAAFAVLFYVLGRTLLKLARAPKSETGVPEAIVGFLIAGLVVTIVRMPVRLLLATFAR